MPIESDDIVLNKISIIQRSVARAIEEYKKDPTLSRFTELDALILNLERACQATIDLGMHIVSSRKLGMPQSSSDAFKILHLHSILKEETALSLISMVGFRNIAIHEYQKLNLNIVHDIMKKKLPVFSDFINELGFHAK
jgi:uncharacterized protein YutE (UPF0331/DUF86 family)